MDETRRALSVLRKNSIKWNIASYCLYFNEPE